MAFDKVIDSAQLDADIKSIADAIREKAGVSDSFVFPDGFIEAVSGISAGGGSFATGTHTMNETASASTIVITHGLGVPPTKFCWFVSAPVVSKLNVSSNQALSFLYADNEKICCAGVLSTSSSNHMYNVTTRKIERLSPKAETIYLSNSSNVHGGVIGSGVTITWMAWGD